MANNRELLKEALADAKSLREMAICLLNFHNSQLVVLYTFLDALHK